MIVCGLNCQVDDKISFVVLPISRLVILENGPKNSTGPVTSVERSIKPIYGIISVSSTTARLQ